MESGKFSEILRADVPKRDSTGIWKEEGKERREAGRNKGKGKGCINLQNRQ